MQINACFLYYHACFQNQCIVHIICILNYFLNTFKDSEDVKALMILEKVVGFKQGKGGMCKTCINVKKDVQEDDADTFLKSSEEEQLKIVLLLKKGE